MTKVIFIELDGTLIHPREEDHQFIRGSTPEETAEREARGLLARSIVSDIALPDFAYERLMYYKNQGWMVVVMTHQPLVGLGKRTLDQVYQIFLATNHLLDNILDGFLVCTDHPEAVIEAYRREPDKNRLLDIFLRETNSKRSDLEAVMVVSHIEADYLFAAHNGFKFRKANEFL